jgi:hypothetical protein
LISRFIGISSTAHSRANTQVPDLPFVPHLAGLAEKYCLPRRLFRLPAALAFGLAVHHGALLSMISIELEEPRGVNGPPLLLETMASR